MNPASTTLMHSSRWSFCSGGDAIEYGREIDFPSFSAKIEMNWPAWNSNTRGSPSNVNRIVRLRVRLRDVEDFLDDRGMAGAPEPDRRGLAPGPSLRRAGG